MPGVIIVLKYPIPLFLFNWEGGNVSEYSDLGNCWQKICRNDKNNATLKTVQPKFSPDWGENVDKNMSTWNLGIILSLVRYYHGTGTLETETPEFQPPGLPSEEKMNKCFALLMLVFLLSACSAAAPLPPPTDTLSDTPTPLSAATDTPGSPIIPSGSAPTITAIPHSALATSGPYLAYLHSQGNQYEIALLDADGKGQELIPFPADANVQTGLPSLSDTLSPDGKWLAYYTGSAGQCFGNGRADTADLALNLLDLTDGKSRLVTNLLSHDYPANFARAAGQLNSGITADLLQNAFVCGITQSISWSPDGRILAFAGQMDGVSSDLYLYNMASQAIKRLSSGPQELQGLAWSPDGRWILSWSSYSSGEGTVYDLYATSLDGSIIHKLPLSRCDTSMWLDDQTCFSFEDENGVGTFNLSLLNIETGAVIPVWSGEFSSQAVSADHQWLAYFSHYSYRSLFKGSDPNFVPGLYLVNLGTLKSSRVVLPVFDDSQTLQALGSGDRTFMLLDTKWQTLDFLSPDGELSSTGINADSISLSPDRQTLVAFGQKIHFLKADGTPLRDVDLPAGLVSRNIVAILWRPDSSGLFFTYLAPLQQLYALDLSAGSPRLVDNADTLALGPADFTWVSLPKNTP